ncbi:MAG TPA: cellulase N-terminal Ig-like domain-containing protein, partial [Chryseosolibacter sp.]|nr:cellulase N-terminal Ig-like domain-containing protein [Chryseosolibacter sp.]
MKSLLVFLLIIPTAFLSAQRSWIRINSLGYKPGSIKVAVFCSKDDVIPRSFSLVDERSGEAVFKSRTLKHSGPYGPFRSTFRLDFTSMARPGRYFIDADGVISPVFTIGDDVYAGTADFCLQYMRQ